MSRAGAGPTIAPVVAEPRNLSLEQLDRLARAFDEISDETGARYSAGAFVRWLRAEALQVYNDPAGRPRQMVARSPRCSPLRLDLRVTAGHVWTLCTLSRAPGARAETDS